MIELLHKIARFNSVNKKNKKRDKSKKEDLSRCVLKTGLEPVRPNGHWILSPTCLPIPPPKHQTKKGIAPFFNWSERRDSNSRPPPWQGDALPAELLSLNYQAVFRVNISGDAVFRRSENYFNLNGCLLHRTFPFVSGCKNNIQFYSCNEFLLFFY